MGEWLMVPTSKESKVFSRADVSNVTWGVCTIIGLTGPGGP